MVGVVYLHIETTEVYAEIIFLHSESRIYVSIKPPLASRLQYIRGNQGKNRQNDQPG